MSGAVAAIDFTFSADALRDSVRDVLAGEAADGHIRAMVDGDDEALAASWEQAATLGWPALLVPPSAGGPGLGFVDAVRSITVTSAS